MGSLPVKKNIYTIQSRQTANHLSRYKKYIYASQLFISRMPKSWYNSDKVSRFFFFVVQLSPKKGYVFFITYGLQVTQENKFPGTVE